MASIASEYLPWASLVAVVTWVSSVRYAATVTPESGVDPLCALLYCGSGQLANPLNRTRGTEHYVVARCPEPRWSKAQGGLTPLSGVTVAAYRTDDTQVTTATSDAQGKYSLAIDATPLDGDGNIMKSGYTDTYLYPASPWIQDDTIIVSLLSTSTFGLLVTFAGGDSSKGVIIANIIDASGTPVTGAKVSSTPSSGVYKYSLTEPARPRRPPAHRPMEPRSSLAYRSARSW